MELIIPIVALGGILSINKKKKKEGFYRPKNSLPNTNLIPLNFPIVEKVTRENNTNYFQTNSQGTADYFQELNLENNKPNPNSLNEEEQYYIDMAGREVRPKDLKVKGMVPYYKKNTGQNVHGSGQAGQFLDNMIGSGNYHHKKEETAPLFSPEDHLQNVNGSPSTTEFMQTRINPSLSMNNVLPFSQQYVGPGLNEGYSASGSGGFNSGSLARNEWLPKSVNELRVETNPKITFGLEGHEGPAGAPIKKMGKMGKMEKHLPEGFYHNSPNRYLTNTGDTIAPAARSFNIPKNINRTSTSVQYAGGASVGFGQQSAPKRPLHKASTTQQLSGPPLAPVGGQISQNYLDHSTKSYQKYGNNRTIQKDPHATRGAKALVNALTSPFTDLLKPTRKEYYSVAKRNTGNIGSLVSSSPSFNPGDRTNTTIKETTSFNPFLKGARPSMVSGQGGYTINNPYLKATQKSSLHDYYQGGATYSNSKPASYNSSFNATTTTSRGQADRTNPGGTQLFNGSINQTNSNLKSNMHSSYLGTATPISGAPPSSISDSATRIPVQNYENLNSERMDSQLLNAFKNNPFTHSLNSVA
jgi:hypothetical protein